MTTETENLPPPLQGCLYCHSEETTALVESRKFLGVGGDFPTLKCSHCNSVAFLDYTPDVAANWRIRYRRVSSAPKYYYVALHLGKAGWLSAHKALAISTDGYAQRMRVAQVKMNNFTWLQPVSLSSPPAFIQANERVYMTLKAITLYETPAPSLLFRVDQGAVLDSGKLYVTDQRLHFLGQRGKDSLVMLDIQKIEYDEKSWVVYLNKGAQMQHYRGVNIADQFDAQLIAAIIEALWLSAQKA